MRKTKTETLPDQKKYTRVKQIKGQIEKMRKARVDMGTVMEVFEDRK